VAKRRVEFESDRAAFVERWKADEEALRQAVAGARERLETVTVPDSVWDRAVSLSIHAGSEGHRADIAVVKAARALAALTESEVVEIRHLVEAARFVFPHRMPVSAAETVEAAADRLDDLLGSLDSSTHGATASDHDQSSTSATDTAENDETARESSTPDSSLVDDSELMQVPGAAASGSLVFDFLKKKRRSS
jgi:Mg-chelatase subunit ChlI